VSAGSILLLSVGLAMDATAAAAARGAAATSLRWRAVLAVALLFGGFQALMPLIGWAIGGAIGPRVEAWDHWIAFGLLAAIGLKMLWEARAAKPAADADGRVLVVLAVATSVDALAAGVTLPLVGAPLLPSIVTIGITTAVLSGVGYVAGRRLGAAIGGRLDAVGGLVLIGLGVKILAEHL
jgi:putative Mn2+ efflux pump MntP